MSTSWSRQIGSFVGGTLAGPTGAILGGIGGSILGKATGVDDPIRDAIGGVMGEQAGNLLARLNPQEKQQVNHDLQTAFRDAFREALYDLGGTFCFASAWQSSHRALPADISAPLMALKHAQDELAAQVCERLQALDQALDEERLFPLQPLEDQPAATVYAYVAAQPSDDLEEAFFELVWPHVGEMTNLQRELNAYHFNLRSYLRRHLFNRLLIHLGEHLKQRPEAWRAFNRLVLEEMRLRVLALDSGQAHITGQLEQIIAQLSRSLADNSQDSAISSLTDELAELVTAIGRVENKQNEGFDGLLARVDEQHNEVMTSLRALIGIEETVKRTIEEVISDLIGGLSRLPTNYGSRIENFMHEYLGTSKRQVPFGGRDRELAALDAWLNDPNAPPYALLAAEAGRGKSALLVHWVQSLVARDKATVVFVPVSIRFDTNRATVAFTALAARLGEVYGEPIEWKNLSAHQWQGVCETYLRRPSPDGKPLVVILDGLDEAADFSIGASFFPSSRFNLEAAAPTGVRAVVSARYLAGDVDESGWRRRLGWESETLAVNLPLPPLTQDGLRDVLHQMGNPLDQLATNVDVVGQLYRLSEGDPLLVRLYVEALLPYGERAAIMTPEQLAAIQPGLSGYFERWWEEQRNLWGKQRPLQEKSVRIVLSLLACALGPLDQDTLLELAPPEADLDNWTLEDALEPLARFIVGNGQELGYVFTHPRLGYYFWRRLSKRKQRKWEEHFLNFGRHTLETLNDGTLHPHNASPYAIQYYGAHLERADVLPETLYALVSEGWMRAWEALEGTYAGFLNDVGRAWRRAEDERDMAMIVKCALCQASVAALSANIPHELLAKAVRHGVLTPVQGVVIVQQTHDETQKAQALSALAPYLPSELFRQVLQITLQIQFDFCRAEALSGLVVHLPSELFGEALAAACQIESDQYRAEALSGLAAHLPAELLAQVLQIAQAIQSESSRADALGKLAPHLPNHLLAQALQNAQTMQDEKSRADALAKLLPHLSNTLAQALQAAFAIPDEGNFADVLGGLILNLSGDLKAIFLAEALQASLAIEYEWSRANALSGLAPHLPDDLLAEALQATLAIEYEWSRADALSKLAPHLPDDLLAQALQATLAIQSEGDRADALSGLAPHLPVALLAQALRVTLAIQSEEDRADALSGLAPHLPVTLLAQALQITLAIQSEDSRANALVKLAAHPHLPNDLLNVALYAISNIDSEEIQADTWGKLSKLAPHFPEEWIDSILTEALEVTQAIQFEWKRANALGKLAPHLPDNLLAQALQIAQAIKYEESRADALAQLAPYLPDDLLVQALQAVQGIRDESIRLDALSSKLTPYLPDNLLAQVLQTTQAISDEKLGIDALGELLPHLPDQLLAQALQITQTIADGWHRVNALGKLVPHLPDQLLVQALQTTQTIANGWHRANALGKLAPHLPDNFLAQGLQIVQTIQDEESRVYALGKFAAHLPDHLLAQALQIALAMNREAYRAQALDRLAPHLPDELLTQALQTTVLTDIEEEWDYAYILSRLAPHLSDELKFIVLGMALQATLAIPDEIVRAYLLSELVPHLPDELRGITLSQALQAALALPNEKACASLLASLAPHLPDKLKAAVLTQALQATQAISDEEARVSILGELVPHLPSELLAQALQVAVAMEDVSDRIKALGELAPYLPNTLLAQVLQATQPTELIDELNYVFVLDHLAPHLPDQLLTQALQVAQSMESQWSHAYALEKLAPHLPDELLAQAREAVQAIRDKDNRANALGSLAPHLLDKLPAQALQAVQAMPEKLSRPNTLGRLVSRLSNWVQVEPKLAYAAWQESLRILSARPRPEFLADLHALMPFTFALAGEDVDKVAEGIFHAIQEVCEWWP